jgi:hypothetical protein
MNARSHIARPPPSPPAHREALGGGEDDILSDVRRVAFPLAVVLAASCQDPAADPPWRPPDPEAECDEWGESCLACCDLGYECQRGRCLDASLDLDFDGWPGHWDCDDYEAATFPGAEEICDDEDNNCNGVVDEGVLDEDGHCGAPCVDRDLDGVRSCDGDCDDDDPAVGPHAEEICDGVDNDCDGLSDEGFDQDGDGVGACGAQADCDDADPARRPGREDRCDGVDNDCDGAVDNAPDICGRSGACEAGGCVWAVDAVGGASSHETGVDDGRGGWCSGPADATHVALARAPARGTRDFSTGIYQAAVWLKVDANTASWGDCGPVARLRVNDRDGDGSGTCADCWFGGDVALVPRLFVTPNVYEIVTVDFSIGPDRIDHLIEVVVLRSSCTAVTLCVDQVRIEQQ